MMFSSMVLGAPSALWRDLKSSQLEDAHHGRRARTLQIRRQSLYADGDAAASLLDDRRRWRLTRMSARVPLAALLIATSCLGILARGTREQAQGGDQFLDGIGETSLVARYALNANAEDSARNQLHATLRGNGGTFVDDEQFGRALLLTG